jgi:hypothetical protein
VPSKIRIGETDAGRTVEKAIKQARDRCLVIRSAHAVELRSHHKRNVSGHPLQMHGCVSLRRVKRQSVNASLVTSGSFVRESPGSISRRPTCGGIALRYAVPGDLSGGRSQFPYCTFFVQMRTELFLTRRFAAAYASESPQTLAETTWWLLQATFTTVPRGNNCCKTRQKRQPRRMAKNRPSSSPFQMPSAL